MAAMVTSHNPYVVGSPSTFTTSTVTPSPSSLTTSTVTATVTVDNPQQTNSIYSNQAYQSPNGPDGHNPFTSGAKAAVGVCVVIGFFAAIVISIWYCCCGGREKRKQRQLARQGPLQNDPLENRSVPLNTYPVAPIAPRIVPLSGDAPPPQYAEVVPPRHTRIAGGVTHVREEEEGVISDGKTPLSEIPFEDVVISSASSSSSARDFGRVHHGAGGNTFGHTNS